MAAVASKNHHLAALAEELGVAESELGRRGVAVAVSTRPDRVRILRHGALTLIAAPRELAPLLEERLRAAQAVAAPLTGAWLEGVLGPVAEYILPWVSSTSLATDDGLTTHSGKARLLGAEELPLLQGLEQAGASRHVTGFKTDWEQGGFGLPQAAVAVVLAGGNVVAAAGMRPSPHGTAQLGAMTHPAFRRLGYAKQALSLVAAETLKRGLLPEYRCLASDAPARRLAARVGFRERYHFLLAALRRPRETKD